MDFDEFTTKTNIAELVLEEYRRKHNDENLNLSSEAMERHLKFYYHFRQRTDDWQRKCIKNLRFAHCKCTSDSGTLVEPSNDNHSGNSGDEPKKIDLNDFQRKITALSAEDFIEQTNIKEIVSNEFHRMNGGKREMNENDMQIGLAYFEKLRSKPRSWHKTAMTHLVFKTCQCKREKQFAEKCMATDEIETREMETQCEMIDFQTNEITDHNSQANDIGIQSYTICHANLAFTASESHLEDEIEAENQHGE